MACICRFNNVFDTKSRLRPGEEPSPFIGAAVCCTDPSLSPCGSVSGSERQGWPRTHSQSSWCLPSWGQAQGPTEVKGGESHFWGGFQIKSFKTRLSCVPCVATLLPCHFNHAPGLLTKGHRAGNVCPQPDGLGACACTSLWLLHSAWRTRPSS